MMRNLFDAIFRRTQHHRLSIEDFTTLLHDVSIVVEPSPYGWRCSGGCERIQKPGSVGAWIADGSHRGDPLWSIVHQTRRSAYNGQSSRWCLDCCRTFKPLAPGEHHELRPNKGPMAKNQEAVS